MNRGSLDRDWEKDEITSTSTGRSRQEDAAACAGFACDSVCADLTVTLVGTQEGQAALSIQA